MKKQILLLLITFATIISGCIALLDSPGTLGAVADTNVNCSESDIGYELDHLAKTKNFKIPERDTTVVQYWVIGGYDFLNYKCLKIKNRIYMITIYTETLTSISIRSYYNRFKKKWIYATDFNSKEEYNAEKAMEYLLKFTRECK